MSVYKALLRIHRPIILWFAVIVLAVEAIGVVIITSATDLQFSLWLAIAGSAVKYWTLVIGIMLVAMHLRQFVANGVTRREFVAGAALFMLTVAGGFAVAVVLGHCLESAVAGAIGERAAGYPVLSAGGLLGELGRVLPQAIAWPLSGALIAVGFYRFRAWLGLIVMVAGALPAAVAGGLVSLDEQGHVRDLLPYAPALLIWLVVTGLGAVALHLLTRDVAIRPARG